jgi:predicted ATPase
MAPRTRIVLTGGPCAGKSTIAQVLEKAFQNKLVILPEAASLLFGGGFPRWGEPESVKGLQNAIFHVQRGLERNFAAHHPDKMLIMDRGTVDGAAYWPEGADAFWQTMGTTLKAELGRYDLVVYLESAGREAYQENVRRNPSRTETWEQAAILDSVTLKQWQSHPRLRFINNNTSFSAKIASVLSIVEEEIKDAGI